MLTVLVAAGLAVSVYAVLALVAWRRPLLARLALREAVRRPWQSAIVIGGLMIGTGAIVGPQVWGDSVADSLAAAAYHSWGRVDFTVSAGGRYFSPNVAAGLAADPRLAHSVAGVQAGLELVGSVVDLDRDLGKPTVRLIGFDPAAQAPFGTFVLTDGRHTDGQDLPPGEVLTSRSLAESLEARPGDRLRVSIGVGSAGKSIEVRVAGVVRPEGPGAYGLRPALFMLLSTAQGLASDGLINVVRITARGDGQAEIDAARRAAPAVEAAAKLLAGRDALEVRSDKAAEADAFEKQNEDLRPLLGTLSLFVVAVGAALVVSLALALAEERRPRLAVLRALGLSRRGLVAISTLEGALYSAVAALAGILPGALIGGLMSSYAADSVAERIAGRDVAFQPSVRPGTVAVGIAIGALFTLSTLFLASIRTSRMTIASAIKDLPEPAQPEPRSWPRRAMLAGLAVIGLPAALAGSPPLRLLGGLALIALATALARERLPDRARATVAGVATAVWSLGMLAVAFGQRASPSPEDVAVGLEVLALATLASTFGFSVLLAANMRLLEKLAALLGAPRSGLRVALRPTLAYLGRRPIRAGLAIGAFALVVAMLTILTVVASAARPAYKHDSGGYDVVVTSSGKPGVTLPASAQAQVARQVPIATRPYLGPVRVTDASGGVIVGWHEVYVPLYELSDAAMKEPLPPFSQRGPGFSSDEAVWRALRSDPNTVISSLFNPGTTITLIAPQGAVQLKIAASFAPGMLNGVAASPRALAPFSGSPAGSTLLVQTRPGVDATGFGRAIRRSLLSDGVDASPTSELLDQGQVQGNTWNAIFRLLMLIGVTIGVLSFGVLALRAVIERRRAIGVLRALGYQPRHVLVGMLAEAAIAVSLGVGVGMVVGLVAVSIMLNGLAQLAGRVALDPAGAATSLALVYATVLIVTMAATAGPALRASRVAPAAALRQVA